MSLKHVSWILYIVGIAVVAGSCKPTAPSSPAEHANQLSLPAEIASEVQAWEIARIWKTKNGQMTLIAPKTDWNSHEWGIMLSDFAQHVANSKGLNEKVEREAFLAELKKRLDEEWKSPTDTATGRLYD